MTLVMIVGQFAFGWPLRTMNVEGDVPVNIQPDKVVDACGADGCGVPFAAVSQIANTSPVAAFELQVVSDVICPWCYVGKRHLEQAIRNLKAEGISFAVRWLPFELNPDMPKEGLDRQEYRSQKFGSWERSQALDAKVAAAGRADGIEFRHDLMKRTPNTFDAHRLIWLAGREGVQDAVVEGLFKAYFTEGRDVGDQSVLTDVAVKAALNRVRVAQFLQNGEGVVEVRHEIKQAQSIAFFNSVPTFIMNGQWLFSGAQQADLMTETFRHAIKLSSI